MNDSVIFSVTLNDIINVEQKEEEQKSQQLNTLLQWELMEDLDNNKDNNKVSDTTGCMKFKSATSLAGYCNQYQHNSNDNNRFSISRTAEKCYGNGRMLLNISNNSLSSSNNSIIRCQLLGDYCHQIIHPELYANSVVFAGNA